MKHFRPLVPLVLLALAGCSVPLGTPGPAVPLDPAPPIPVLSHQVWYEMNFQTLVPPSLAAAEARLDAVADLGANVVWLMPLQPEGRDRAVGSPYALASYDTVSPDLGTLDDLRRLVNAAHRRGLAVVMDWVADHTAWDHRWVTDHPDWYQHNAAGAIIGPPGQNWTDVAALNYRSSGLRQAMVEALAFWVTQAGVDGYRCDYADAVPSDFWKTALAQTEAAAGRKLLWLAEGSRADQFSAGFALNYAWTWADTLPGVFAGSTRADSLWKVDAQEYGPLGAVGGEKLRYTSNHDLAAWKGTPATLLGGQDGALAAFALTVFYRGVPLVSSGQEAGALGTIGFFGPSPVAWDARPEVTAGHRQVLALRAAHEAFRTGTRQTFADPRVAAFTRTGGGETRLVAVNTKATATAWAVPPDLQGPFGLGPTVSLGPYEVRVW